MRNKARENALGTFMCTKRTAENKNDAMQGIVYKNKTIEIGFDVWRKLYNDYPSFDVYRFDSKEAFLATHRFLSKKEWDYKHDIPRRNQ